MINKLLILTISIISFLVSRAQDSKDLECIYLDLSQATICGLDSVDFSHYYGNQHGGDNQYANLVFKRFKSKFTNIFNKETNNLFKEKKLKGFIVINEISENAGYNGMFNVIKSLNNEPIISIPFEVNDGKWNKFEELLYENAEEGAKFLSKKIKTLSSYDSSRSKLYDKKGNEEDLDLYMTLNSSNEKGYNLTITKISYSGGKKHTETISSHYPTLEEAIACKKKIEEKTTKETIYKCKIEEIK